MQSCNIITSGLKKTNDLFTPNRRTNPMLKKTEKNAKEHTQTPASRSKDPIEKKKSFPQCWAVLTPTAAAFLPTHQHSHHAIS